MQCDNRFSGVTENLFDISLVTEAPLWYNIE